jgi:hypothetical protein
VRDSFAPLIERETGSYSCTRTWILYGNISELANIGGQPGKSYLFFLTIHDPGIRLTGDRVEELGKHFMSEVSGAFLTILENARERFIRTPGRTHNRIRSPR